MVAQQTVYKLIFMSRFQVVASATVVGFFLGGYVGIAAFGGAISGAVPFALAFLLLAMRATGPRSRAEVDEQPVVDHGSEDAAHVEGGGGKELLDAVEHQVKGIVRLACLLWNVEMQILEHARLMPYFVKFPWGLAVLAVGLLTVFFPLGLVFVVTGAAALSRGMKAERGFRVLTG